MQGIIAAVPTPTDAAGKPQCAPFIEHCQWAMTNGCDGLNVLGSTGEANSFDKGTRADIMAWAVKAVDPVRLMVGTGTPSLAETISLTCHADDLGFAAALVLPPYYYKPTSDDGLFRWYEALHEALGTRPIKVYFYNYPQMTGIPLSHRLLARLCATYPDRFAGIKDSSGDLEYCRELASKLPGFAVFPSSETSLAEAGRSGFAGCISATVNHSSAVCAQIWKDRSDPDPALIEKIAGLRAGLMSHPLIPSIKYMVARRTGNAIWHNAVPPFLPLDSAAKAALDAIECAPTVDPASQADTNTISSKIEGS